MKIAYQEGLINNMLLLLNMGQSKAHMRPRTFDPWQSKFTLRLLRLSKKDKSIYFMAFQSGFWPKNGFLACFCHKKAHAERSVQPGTEKYDKTAIESTGKERLCNTFFAGGALAHCPIRLILTDYGKEISIRFQESKTCY